MNVYRVIADHYRHGWEDFGHFATESAADDARPAIEAALAPGCYLEHAGRLAWVEAVPVFASASEWQAARATTERE